MREFVERNKHHILIWVAQNLSVSRGAHALERLFKSMESSTFEAVSRPKSYVGISYNGTFRYEKIADRRRLVVAEADVVRRIPSLKGTDLKLISTVYGKMKKSYTGMGQGARSHISLFGQEVGKGIEGLNVVVFDPKHQKIIDSKHFHVNKGNQFSSDTVFSVSAGI